MRKILKTLVAMMLVALLLVPASLTAFADDTVEIALGDNVTSVLDMSTGVLTISGTGETNYFKQTSNPLSSYKQMITSVVIEPGVTTIGQYAFNGCTNLTSVILPDTIVEIYDRAFSGSGLTSLTMPNGMTGINMWALYNCTSLETLTLPSSMEYINRNAIYSCTALKTIINWYDGEQSVSDYAFYLCGSNVEGEKIAYCYPSNTTFAAAMFDLGYTVKDIADLPQEGSDGLPSYPDVYTIDADNDIAYIYGTVDPAILSAEVTLSTYFHIAPNAPEGDRFISPDMAIENTSTMPIYVDAVSMKATGDAPKIVAHDKYSDEEWSELGVADTAANIALGLTGAPTAGNFFFDAEDAQSPICLNENLLSAASDTLGMQAKFGLSWPSEKTFKYELVLEIGLRN